MLPEFFNATVSEAEEQSESIVSSPYSREIFVLSIGGSLLYQEGALDFDSLKAIADSIRALHDSGYKFAIVIGGGVLAKDFIETAKMLGANNFELDEIGIFATRLNAMLFIQALEPAFSEVLTDIKRAKTIIDSGKIPVFGGLIPGVTTDFDSAIIAEYLNAKFVNLSNVDGVFDSNPKENPKAVLFKELSYDDLIKILVKEESKPRQNLVLDVPAALVLKRSKIPALFLNGRNIENFESAIRGQDFLGTIVDADSASEESFSNPEENSWEETKLKKPKRKLSKRTAKKRRKREKDDDPDRIAMGLRL